MYKVFYNYEHRLTFVYKNGKMHKKMTNLLIGDALNLAAKLTGISMIQGTRRAK